MKALISKGGANMKVLILSVTTGMGHHQTGMALKNEFEKNGAACVMLDAFEYVNPILSETISRGYLLSTKLTPKMYGQFYRMAEKKQSVDPSFMKNTLNKILSSKLMKFIKNYEPDAIICTHIFAAQIVSYLRTKGKLACLCMGIITDFTVHPFWEETNLDYYVTASRMLNLQLEKKGIPKEKALPVGIPIHPKFSKSMLKQEARNKLGIDDKTTVLVMMGSMGYGHIMKDIIKLDNMEGDFQVLCVCGNNKRLHTLISGHSWNKKVRAYGYVDNVDIMMDASDVIVTKPGGLTTSEFLAKGLPAILLDPIPGHEDRNVEFLLNNGLAIKVSDTFPIDEAMYQLVLHKWHLEMLGAAARFMGKPNAAKDICDFVFDACAKEDEKTESEEGDKE